MITTATTTRPVDLGQLANELGSTALSANTHGDETTVTCHDDGVTAEDLQVAVDSHVPYLAPDSEAVRTALGAVAQMVVTDRIAADTLTYAESQAVAAAFPTWAPGQTVQTGDLRYYDGGLVECVQGHTTQADWAPADAPALWKVWRDPDEAAPWVQPQGAHDAYQAGDRVTHNGKTWVSNVNGNVWEPPTQWTEAAD